MPSVCMWCSVSVEEFKKMLVPQASVAKSNNQDGDTADANTDDEDARRHRRAYASKIIAKFMSQDSFLDIASEDLRILNKSVWSFGSFLRNDLMMCAGLSSKVDLFYDAESAVKKALQPNFQQFTATPEFIELMANSQLSYTPTLIVDDLPLTPVSADENQALTPSSPLERLSMSHAPVASESSSYVTMQRVLENRRLCSIFWVFLFKEGTHEQLSLWMDFRYQLLPILEAFIKAAEADVHSYSSDDDYDHVSECNNQTEEAHDQQPAPEEFIDQILSIGSRIAIKYLAVTATNHVAFFGQDEQDLLQEYESHVGTCMEAGSFSLEDAEMLRIVVDRISVVIENNLKVNHFVRFMASESFKTLVSSYQSRLLSPSGLDLSEIESPKALPAVRSDDHSSSSDSSMTTLQELFHCMNVPSHQPQRIRGKKFELRELFQRQLRGESQGRSLISSVLHFRLDANGDTSKEPKLVKHVLHSLATKDSDMQHHHAIPEHVESFFCPGGAQVIRAKSRPEPKLFHMTIGSSDKSFYAACLTRYVAQRDDSQLTPLEMVLRETEGLEVYVPVGICIISRYPILNTLKLRLNAMHVNLMNDEDYVHDPYWMPSQAHMAELLAPFDFTTTAVDPSTPTLSQLTNFVDFSMEELFNCLSVENVVALVSSVMLERQIVLVSSQYSVLTCVGETLKSLLSPLVWSHIFAPILPKSMLECLQCPTPYLFGVHSSYRKDLFEMLAREGSCENIIVVDLDSNSISSTVKPQLPPSISQALVAGLQELLTPRIYFSDFVPMCQSMLSSQPRRFPEKQVRACFARAISQCLQRLDEFRFVLSDDFDFVVVFDRKAFLRRLPVEDRSFYRSFLETQVFSHEIASVSE